MSNEQPTETVAATTTEAPAQTAETPAAATTVASEAAATTETAKTEEVKAEETKLDPKDDTKVNPFKVEEIKFSDGIEIDPALAGEFTTVVNELGLSRPAVAKLLALQEKATKAASETGSALWQKTQDEWRAAVQKDPQIGGANWKANEAAIGQVIVKYGSPELRAALDLTGAGNHPEVVRFFAKMATALVEPGFVPAGSASDTPMSPAQRLYPNQGKT